MSWGHRQLFRVFCTAVLIYSISASSTAFSPAHSQYIQSADLRGNHRRQYSPSPFLAAPPLVATTSSSFDYWWPYPPASTTEPPSPTVLPVETGDNDSDSFDGTPSATSRTTVSTTSEFDSNLYSTTFSQNSAAIGIPSITITALPPLTSPSHAHTVSTYRKPMNHLLFVSLFGIIGGAMGIVCGWWGYSLWRIRCRDSDDAFAGPRYVGVEGDDTLDREKDVGHYTHDNIDGSIDEETFAAVGSHLCKTSCILPLVSSHRHEGAEALNRPRKARLETTWPRIGLSALLRSPLLEGFVLGRADSATNSVDGSQSQTFQRGSRAQHLSPNPFGKAAGLEGLLVEDLMSPFAPTVFSSVATSDEDDEDYDARRTVDRRNTVRHKSIRRRIAEKLQLQFSPRRGLARQTSKVEGNLRGRTPELEEGIHLHGVTDSPLTLAGPSKRNKAASNVPGHGRAISDFAVAMDELQTPTRAYTPEGYGSVTSNALCRIRTYSSPLKGLTEADDKYTLLPKRKPRSPRKLKSVRSPKRRTDILEDSDAPSIPSPLKGRHILPASPPLVSSPRLESELFFTTGLASVTSFSRSFTPVKYEKPDLDYDYHTRDSPVCRGPSGPRQANKLQLKKSPARTAEAKGDPPSLYAKDWYESLSPSPLHRDTGRSSSSSPTKYGSRKRVVRSRERSSTAPSRPVSPKERYEARRSALDKVEAIVSCSWSARNMRGVPAPSSPTMFGAQVDNEGGTGNARLNNVNEDFVLMLGIEQTLGSP